MSSSRWIRWRLVAVCVGLGAILPVVTLAQAMVNIYRLRAMASDDAQIAAAYLVGVTFSLDTLGTLSLWVVQIAVVLYGLALAGRYLRGKLKGQQHV